MTNDSNIYRINLDFQVPQIQDFEKQNFWIREILEKLQKSVKFHQTDKTFWREKYLWTIDSFNYMVCFAVGVFLTFKGQ
jgi:hypothetical protein